MTENMMLMKNNIFFCPTSSQCQELDNLKTNFFGYVVADIKEELFTQNTNVYLCGDISENYELVKDMKYKNVYAIREISQNVLDSLNYKIIGIGQVPINMHNLGVYFRNVFDSKNYFNLIKNGHEFQSLTESNKPGSAFRKGIYLTNVEQDQDYLKFNLLRCSSNLNGPTDNFREIDKEVVSKVNELSKEIFQEPAELNHVLAQIYINTSDTKAKIKSHSDKTKDMPLNGVMAFCTFYDDMNYDKITKSRTDMFDYCCGETSVFTKLCFKLKSCVESKNLIKEFNVTLYPNSIFFVPLSTNRLYTHEIRPSILPYDKIPTRMGYVVRCSKTKAIFKDGQTYINDDGTNTKLENPTDENIEEIRKLYFEENTTDKVIEYGKVYYSLNNGDYMKPNL